MGSSKKSAKGRLDKYYHLAKDQGYRARSAFKLLHINKKYGFLENSKIVLDLCAAPGGWLQVAAKFVPKPHVIVGVDLVPIKAIPGVITIVGDITTDKCRSEIKKELKDWKADVVLHDGAPNVGKSWLHDAFSQADLVLSSFKLACDFLRPDGIFVTKVFRSKEYNSLMWIFKQLFTSVEATKPASSRNVSAEIFVICRGYKAFGNIDKRFFDSKTVFAETEDSLASLQAAFKSSFLSKNLQVRSREGYEDGITLMYKEKKLSDFLSSVDPISFLADTNRILVDFENFNVSQIIQNIHIDPSISSSFEDIKILGKKEIKELLKWRKKALLLLDKENSTNTEPKPDTSEIIDPETTNEKLLEDALKKIRKEKKKKLLMNAKQRMRMQLKMDSAMDFVDDQNFDDINGDHFFPNVSGKLSDIQEPLKDGSSETELSLQESITDNTKSISKKRKKENSCLEKAADIEFVAKDTNFDVVSRNLLSDPAAVDLALSYCDNRKRAKASIIDDSFNRYSHGDENAPQWFIDDENKHNKPQKPITKEAMDVVRERLKILDSKPIKKILEAKGRQKKRLFKKIESVKNQAEELFNSDELNKKSKNEKLNILTKSKMNKPKNKKKIVVAKGSLKGKKGRPKGLKGRYKMVDRRLKKDLAKNKPKRR